MRFVEDSGTTLASSTQTLLLSGDAGSKKEKIDTAVKNIPGARDEQQPTSDVPGKNT
jgi:hypothetical protein